MYSCSFIDHHSVNKNLSLLVSTETEATSESCDNFHIVDCEKSVVTFKAPDNESSIGVRSAKQTRKSVVEKSSPALKSNRKQLNKSLSKKPKKHSLEESVNKEKSDPSESCVDVDENVVDDEESNDAVDYESLKVVTAQDMNADAASQPEDFGHVESPIKSSKDMRQENEEEHSPALSSGPREKRRDSGRKRSAIDKDIVEYSEKDSNEQPKDTKTKLKNSRLEKSKISEDENDILVSSERSNSSKKSKISEDEHDSLVSSKRSNTSKKSKISEDEHDSLVSSKRSNISKKSKISEGEHDNLVSSKRSNATKRSARFTKSAVQVVETKPNSSSFDSPPAGVKRRKKNVSENKSHHPTPSSDQMKSSLKRQTRSRRVANKKVSLAISPDRSRRLLKRKSKNDKGNDNSTDFSSPVHLNLLSSLPRVSPQSGLSFRRNSSFIPFQPSVNGQSLKEQDIEENGKIDNEAKDPAVRSKTDTKMSKRNKRNRNRMAHRNEIDASEKSNGYRTRKSPESNRDPTGNSPESNRCTTAMSPENNRGTTAMSPESNRGTTAMSPESNRDPTGKSPKSKRYSAKISPKTQKDMIRKSRGQTILDQNEDGQEGMDLDSPRTPLRPESKSFSLRRRAILGSAHTKGLQPATGELDEQDQPILVRSPFAGDGSPSILPSPSCSPVHYFKTVHREDRESNVFKLPDLSHKIIQPDISRHGNRLRRSKRTRVQRLNTHKGEGIIYRRDSTGYGLVVEGVQPSMGEAILIHQQKEKEKRYTKKKMRAKAVPAKPKRISSHWTVEQQVTDSSEISVINPETQEPVVVELVSRSGDAEWVGPDLTPVTPRDTVGLCMLLNQPSFGTGELHIRPLCEKHLQLTVQTVVYVVIHGKLCVTINNTSFIMESRDHFFVPRGSTYRIKNLRKDIAQLSFVNFHDAKTDGHQPLKL